MAARRRRNSYDGRARRRNPRVGCGRRLILSLLGYGKVSVSEVGMAVDPVLVALLLVVYNLLVVVLLGVPWRKRPGFTLFGLDWLVVSAAVLLTGGFYSPFLILYYSLVIGAALRVGLPRSLLLVGACALVYAALSTARPTPVEAIHLPCWLWASHRC